MGIFREGISEWLAEDARVVSLVASGRASPLPSVKVSPVVRRVEDGEAIATAGCAGMGR